jgi:hypothetical protein
MYLSKIQNRAKSAPVKGDTSHCKAFREVAYCFREVAYCYLVAKQCSKYRIKISVAPDLPK